MSKACDNQFIVLFYNYSVLLYHFSLNIQIQNQVPKAINILT